MHFTWCGSDPCLLQWESLTLTTMPQRSCYVIMSITLHIYKFLTSNFNSKFNRSEMWARTPVVSLSLSHSVLPLDHTGFHSGVAYLTHLYLGVRRPHEIEIYENFRRRQTWTPISCIGILHANHCAIDVAFPTDVVKPIHISVKTTEKKKNKNTSFSLCKKKRTNIFRFGLYLFPFHTYTFFNIVNKQCKALLLVIAKSHQGTISNA